MPVMSWAHSKYWSGAAGGPVDSPGFTPGGYLPWQTTVIAASGFGASQVVWEWIVQKVTRTYGDIR